MSSLKSNEKFLRMHIGTQGECCSSDRAEWFQLCNSICPSIRINVDYDFFHSRYTANTPGTSTFVFEFNTSKAPHGSVSVPVELKALEAKLRDTTGVYMFEKVGYVILQFVSIVLVPLNSIPRSQSSAGSYPILVQMQKQAKVQVPGPALTAKPEPSQAQSDSLVQKSLPQLFGNSSIPPSSQR